MSNPQGGSKQWMLPGCVLLISARGHFGQHLQLRMRCLIFRSEALSNHLLTPKLALLSNPDQCSLPKDSSVTLTRLSLPVLVQGHSWVHGPLPTSRGELPERLQCIFQIRSSSSTADKRFVTHPHDRKAPPAAPRPPGRASDPSPSSGREGRGAGGRAERPRTAARRAERPRGGTDGAPKARDPQSHRDASGAEPAADERRGAAGSPEVPPRSAQPMACRGPGRVVQRAGPGRKPSPRGKQRSLGICRGGSPARQSGEEPAGPAFLPGMSRRR